MSVTVESFIDERIQTADRASARLALEWLRRTPTALDTVKEVYAEGARGNVEAFRSFAWAAWSEINTEYNGLLESWDVAPDDEQRWVGTLALIVGAWGVMEMGQRV